MADFAVGGVNYRTRKMDAFTQLHVARALAPLIAKLGPQFITQPSTFEELIDKIMPAIVELSEMEEERVNNILYKCLAVVTMQQGTVWTPIFNVAAKRLMFDDLSLQAMIEIAINVIRENLANFSIGNGQSTQEAPSPTNIPSPISLPFQMERRS